MKVRRFLVGVKWKKPFVFLPLGEPRILPIQNYETIVADLVSFRRFLEGMLRSGMVDYTKAPDKRRARDDRRRMVCEVIFACWDEIGRNVSYTTNPETSECGGVLVDFVNAVVRCISEPPGELSGSAIKSEIEDFKRQRDAYLAANPR